MRKKRRKRLPGSITRLIKEQRKDMNRRDWIDNDFNSEEEDIYNRRRRSRGPGYKNK